MLRSVITTMVAIALFVAPAVAAQQQHGTHSTSGHPAGGGHPASGGSHATFGSWHSATTHTTPLTHGVAHQPQHAAVIPANRTVNGTPYYRGTTHYTSSHTPNATYARNANAYPGASWVYTGGHRWYNGYWHQYWASADWVWYNGFYGFWFPLDGVTVFVYEAAPGVCQYWDGSQWVPYYDPSTGFYCPY